MIVLILSVIGLWDTSGHGAVVFPPPRNAIDSNLAPWSEPVPYPVPNVDAWCPVSGTNGSLSGVNGQACFWFSNGCSIGCPQCDGTTRGPIPNRPENATKMDVCGNGYEATICDPALRTVNTNASCGADNDFYYYSPWRAPGSAGVFDACGMAGGTPKHGGFGAVYTETPHAKQGDLGSYTLPEMPSGTVWTAGSLVEVSWTIQANHGGGYQYRICRKEEGVRLTEECFQKTPLPFEGKQGFRWDGSEEFWFEGTYVSKGTVPKDSMWAMNPIPRNDTRQTKASFEPRCDEIPNCGSTKVDSKCRCSGMWGPFNLEIVDKLRLPSDLPEGEYVLGWRWDCEESNQIWVSCSDIKVVSANKHMTSSS